MVNSATSTLASNKRDAIPFQELQVAFLPRVLMRLPMLVGALKDSGQAGEGVQLHCPVFRTWTVRCMSI